MIVHTDIRNLPVFINAVITVGAFDGVHIGHQKVFNLMKTEAEEINGETVLITFHPHPAMLLQQNTNIYLLNTLNEKIELLSKQGIDHLVIVTFTEDFAKQSADQYVKDFLVKTFHPRVIVIGYDHRFGKDRLGDFEFLEQKAKEFNYTVKETAEYIKEGATVSSTIIRKCLIDTNIELAKKFLGYEYFFSGEVVLGNKLGRTIGYPTANLVLPDKNKLVPGNAVYAVHVLHNNILFKGMMNIGIRPTVAGVTRVIEVNIFDFDKEIYGDTLKVIIKNKLRNEIKFDTLNALKEQLGKDKKDALNILDKK